MIYVVTAPVSGHFQLVQFNPCRLTRFYKVTESASISDLTTPAGRDYESITQRMQFLQWIHDDSDPCTYEEFESVDSLLQHRPEIFI